MHSRNVKPHMINGQGRWRLHAQQDPPEMVFKYCQSLPVDGNERGWRPLSTAL